MTARTIASALLIGVGVLTSQGLSAIEYIAYAVKAAPGSPRCQLVRSDTDLTNLLLNWGVPSILVDWKYPRINWANDIVAVTRLQPGTLGLPPESEFFDQSGDTLFLKFGRDDSPAAVFVVTVAKSRQASACEVRLTGARYETLLADSRELRTGGGGEFVLLNPGTGQTPLLTPLEGKGGKPTQWSEGAVGPRTEITKSTKYVFAAKAKPGPQIAASAVMTRAGFCSNYAETAVRAFLTSQALRCSIAVDHRWNATYSRHYQWCLEHAQSPDAREPQEAKAETESRQKQLAVCHATASKKK